MENVLAFPGSPTLCNSASSVQISIVERIRLGTSLRPQLAHCDHIVIAIVFVLLSAGVTPVEKMPMLNVSQHLSLLL